MFYQCIFIQMQRRWVTGAPFTNYLTSKLEGELQKCCVKQNLAFKMLLVNTVPDNPTTFQDLCEYTKVPSIPPKRNALIQLRDQKVILTFKTYYLKKTCW